MSALATWVFLMSVQAAGTDPTAVFESAYAEREIGLDTDPASDAWAAAPRARSGRNFAKVKRPPHPSLSPRERGGRGLRRVGAASSRAYPGAG